MTLPQLFVDLIDFRSFSNLWYWITLCVVWSSASHWVMGVPYDMVWRAKREGGSAQQDLETLVRIKATRLLWTSREYGIWLVGMVSFLTTVLAILALWYVSEIAQSLLLLFVPFCVVGYVTLRAALRIEAGEGQGPALFRRMFLTRLTIQALGMVSIFVTALVGMFVNFLHFVPQ